LSGMVLNAGGGLRWLERATPDLDKAKTAFRRITADGLRAAAIIDSVRASFRKDPANRTSLDINGLIRDAVALTRADLVRHRIRVEVELDFRIPQVCGDRIQLQQVLLNLITNAIHAMAAKDGARILRLRSEVHHDGVIVSVADTGSGIGAEAVEHIFDPLFTTKSDGMGMGLSICRTIVESHDGRLWFDPNQPEGADFRFKLLADLADSAKSPPTPA